MGVQYQSRCKDIKVKYIIFFDSLNLFLLIPVLFSRIRIKEIYYFDEITFVCRFFVNNRIIKHIFGLNVFKVKNHIGEIRKNNGANELYKIHSDMRRLTVRIVNEEVKENPLINALSDIWNKDKVLHFFEQKIEKYIDHEYRRIRLARWIYEKQSNEDNWPVLHLKSHKWFGSLLEYAEINKVSLRQYKFSGRVSAIFCFYSKVFNKIHQNINGFFQFPLIYKNLVFYNRKKKNNYEQISNSKKHNSLDHKIAIAYSHQGLEFDQSTRNEFFWISGKKISYQNIILYNYSSEIPLKEEVINNIHAKGISVFGSSANVKKWLFTSLAVGLFLKLASNIIKLSFLKIWSFSLYYLINFLQLAAQYSYWYDFFNVNNVRINIKSTYQSNHGQILALDSLGGVSIAYQYSISDIGRPTAILSGCENIQLSFSTFFTKHLWEVAKIPADKIIEIGYIYDYLINLPHKSSSLLKIKNQFENNGVKFTICFFDENSSDKWFVPAWGDEAAQDYEFLFKWVLSDPTIGLICKPKTPEYLFQKISAVSGLLKEVMTTKRCYFHMNVSNVRNSYPAQVASLADICIGKLGGGTAAMEGALIGTPTFLIDTEGFHEHLFYSYQNLSIIFRDWNLLKKNVGLFRSNLKEYNLLGNWKPLLDDLVAQTDGKASERFEDIVLYLTEVLRLGMKQPQLIEYVFDKYKNKWLT